MNGLKRLKGSVVWVALALLLLAACGPVEEQARPVATEGGQDANRPAGAAAINATSPAMDAPEPSDTPVKQAVAAEGAGLEVAEGSQATDAHGLPVGFTADGHPFRGQANAPVVIHEYSDYQCPFCARFYAQTLPALQENQIASGEAVLVYYDFPLDSLHRQARAAAHAARCAGKQGAAAYWAMHDRLFAGLEEWSLADPEPIFQGYAETLELDGEAYAACTTGGEFKDVVQADVSAGARLGVTGTPTFFLNGQKLVGAQPLAVFDEAIATVAGGGQLASNQSPQSGGQPSAAVAPTPAAINDKFAAAKGNPNAPVTIVEYTDYQCPYCSRHATDTLPRIVTDMIDAGRVYYVLKDFPLDNLHPQARSAAEAARCAGEQDAYWEMHDQLFLGQAEWTEEGAAATDIFAVYAAELGLDEAAYRACLDSGRHAQAVQENQAEGQKLGVSGTPYFFVNGFPLNGARPFEHFSIAVEMAEDGRLAEAYVPPQPQQPAQPSGPVEVEIGDAFSLGEAEAPITIVEFTDYQCPFCQRHFAETLPQLTEQYISTGVVRYVIKDMPLNSIHPQAAEAAEAARCADDQGAYLEMHDTLFERQREWSGQAPTEIFVNFAEELGLDAAAFRACLTSGQHEAAVNADLRQGAELGITGTPTFFLNGNMLSGAQPYAVFERAISELLVAEAQG
ncbi:MAG: DsbA family protein [Candidatus Promineifilaceae bacterium]